MLGGGDDAHKFMGRPRLDRADFASIMNPGSRQIYLTFPADSTFREEDVSGYFRYAFHTGQCHVSFHGGFASSEL
jgi:hypothetical protein